MSRYETVDTLIRQIMNLVEIKEEDLGVYSIEWEANPVSDVISDSVLSILMGVEASRASVKSKQFKSADIQSEQR